MYSLHYLTIAVKSCDGFDKVRRHFKISELVGVIVFHYKKSNTTFSHLTIDSGGKT